MHEKHGAPLLSCDCHKIFMNLKLFTAPLSGRMGLVISGFEDADDDATTTSYTKRSAGE
jgi:hypothetical protein